MQMVLNAAYNETSIQEIKNNFVVKKVKQIVKRYDEEAIIFLFGSRARGDWNEESDWDFLILSELDELSNAKNNIRKDVLNEIEYITFDAVFILFHNKTIWEENYAVTNIYESIADEGIMI